MLSFGWRGTRPKTSEERRTFALSDRSGARGDPLRAGSGSQDVDTGHQGCVGGALGDLLAVSSRS
ncbi:MAG: hypothetical protein ACYCTG_11925, partial [Ferrimicrobium sp.]